jgi:hypothetical protein
MPTRATTKKAVPPNMRGKKTITVAANGNQKGQRLRKGFIDGAG